MSPRFEGKTVIITGGSQGIGKATALTFAREGANVVICARREAPGQEALNEIKAAGAKALFIQADVSKSDQVQRLVKETVNAFGRIDCAVNNAAALTDLKFTAQYSEEEFDRDVALNLKSVWLCMRYELEQMIQQSPVSGAIVNVSSVNGLGGVATASFYAMAKAGIIALSKSAAQEYTAQGIRVNALVPGGFDTPMLNSVMDRASGGKPEMRKQVEQGFVSRVPAGRIGRPEEAAEAAIWLCSDSASYVTGHSMIVDGGMTAWAR